MFWWLLLTIVHLYICFSSFLLLLITRCFSDLFGRLWKICVFFSLICLEDFRLWACWNARRKQVHFKRSQSHGPVAAFGGTPSGQHLLLNTLGPGPSWLNAPPTVCTRTTWCISAWCCDPVVAVIQTCPAKKGSLDLKDFKVKNEGRT